MSFRGGNHHASSVLRTLLAALAAPVCACVLASDAGAAEPAAHWSLRSIASPSDFSAVRDNAACEAEEPKKAYAICDTFVVTARNVGGEETATAPVTLKDDVPTGLEVRNISLFMTKESVDHGEVDCTPSPAQCVLANGSGEKPLPLKPDESVKMYVSVLVRDAAARTVVNSVSVSGGGLPEVEAQGSSTVENGIPGFGASFFEAPFLAADGEPATQAGGHPYALNTTIGLSSVNRETPDGYVKATSVEDVRDVVVDLPPGMSGSGVSAARCTLSRLGSKGIKSKGPGESGCPTDTIIGHLRTFPESQAGENTSIYNLLPDRGHAAELGFVDSTGGTHVLYVSLAPTPAGYVLRTTSKEIPQLALLEIIADVYGDPAARDKSEAATPATFTNPSHCTGEPLVSSVSMDSWQHPGSYLPDGTPDLSDPNWVTRRYESPAVTGCDRLVGLFEPSLTATPSSTRAGSPTGLDVDLSVPQKEGPEGQATPPLRDTTVTLPAGMVVDPSSANGLEACSLAQVGMSALGVPDAAPPSCPDGSKIGTVELETPALAMEACKKPATPLQECPEPAEREPTPLTGSIYVAKQGENPFASLLAIYIVIDDPRTGVIVKIPAKVTPDPSTGQLTTTVEDTPQFPFSVLRTHFFSGDTAALSNPATCGSYTVSTQLTPWSAPDSGPAATPTAGFEIDQGADGGPCSPPSFGPALSAGTAASAAGAFSPLSVSFSRQDAEQDIAGVNVTTPPGLLGSLKNVAQCPEPQAAKGDCGADSLIGEASTAVGAGPHPYWVHGGKVYLTGPYGGGAFGLSIVVPTTAGPFTLTGNGGPGREIVRAAIRVDPHTAQITVASDPLPSILEGIPLQIRTVNVTIDRPSFTFNPTNCSRLATTASFTSAQGATSIATAPFYASNCASLPFHPTLTASAGGKASKANGATLTVKVASGPGQANIAKTDLTLPIALPSRLTTIQKACSDTVFEGNPAACPEGSVIGTATVHTPLLKSALTGPAYLVAHGSAAFPDVEFVLQGEGVTLLLDGQTDIKKGITYSRFEAVPDAPVESFEAVLPTGPHSALTANVPAKANYSLCGQSLQMPTVITGQNGKVLEADDEDRRHRLPQAADASAAAEEGAGAMP